MLALVAPPETGAADPGYVSGERHDGGTGHYYFGREIAQFMSHHGAAWLEREARVSEEAPDTLHSLLGATPGMVVADIGAGTGYHSRRLARSVGPEGLVYAVEIQPEMLALLDARAKAEGLGNIRSVLGSETSPALPEASLDLALLVDVYHEFSHPHEMTSAIVRALKPGGRLVLVEFRAEPAVPIHPLHAMTESQIRLELAVQPLLWERTVSDLPWQQVVFYRKSETD